MANLTNATPGKHGAPIYVYNLNCNGIGTTPTNEDSNMTKVFRSIGQWTTILAWTAPGANAMQIVCEGGPDLESSTPGTGTDGTITSTESGAANNCVITKHITLGA